MTFETQDDAQTGVHSVVDVLHRMSQGAKPVHLSTWGLLVSSSVKETTSGALQRRAHN